MELVWSDAADLIWLDSVAGRFRGVGKANQIIGEVLTMGLEEPGFATGLFQVFQNVDVELKAVI